MAITDLPGVGLDRVAIAVSGPTRDLGAFEPPAIRRAHGVGFGSSGTLLGPDAQGVFTYETADTLPADAYRTWRVGFDARREVVLNDSRGNPAAEVAEAV